jgi:hypothetical protein
MSFCEGVRMFGLGCWCVATTEERGEYIARPVDAENVSLGTGESRRAERTEGARGPASFKKSSTLSLTYQVCSTHDLLPIRFSQRLRRPLLPREVSMCQPSLSARELGVTDSRIATLLVGGGMVGRH